MSTRKLNRILLLSAVSAISGTLAFAADAPRNYVAPPANNRPAAPPPNYINGPRMVPTPQPRTRVTPDPNAGNPQGSTRAGIAPQNATEAQNNLQRDRVDNPRGGNERLGNANDRNSRFDEGDFRHHHHRQFVNPSWFYGSAPMTWYYNGGYSYLWPGDYYNYYNDPRDADRYAQGDVQSYPQATPQPQQQPTPVLDQARALNQLESAPRYRELMSELQKSQAQYDSLSAKLVNDVKATPKYQALQKQFDQSEERVEAIQAAAKIPPVNAVTREAQRKLDIKSKMTRMEQDALANDTKAAALKAKIVELTDLTTTMKKQAQQPGAKPQ